MVSNLVLHGVGFRVLFVVVLPVLPAAFLVLVIISQVNPRTLVEDKFSAAKIQAVFCLAAGNLHPGLLPAEGVVELDFPAGDGCRQGHVDDVPCHGSVLAGQHVAVAIVSVIEDVRFEAQRLRVTLEQVVNGLQLLHAGGVEVVLVEQVVYGDIRLLAGLRAEHAVAFEGQYIPGSVVGEAGRVPIVLPFGIEDGVVLQYHPVVFVVGIVVSHLAGSAVRGVFDAADVDAVVVYFLVKEVGVIRLAGNTALLSRPSVV
jgi:hypothetical protein